MGDNMGLRNALVAMLRAIHLDTCDRAADEIERLQRELDDAVLAVNLMHLANEGLRASAHEPPDVLTKQRDHWRKQCRDLQDIVRSIGECISGHDGHVFDDVHALLEQSRSLRAPDSSPASASVDWHGLALDLEAQAKRVESQTVERAMQAGAHGLRLMGAAQPPVPDWQPIESAPKDGTSVLVFLRNFKGGGEVSIAEWVDGHWWDKGQYEPAPSYWMPLPSGPTKAPEQPEVFKIGDRVHLDGSAHAHKVIDGECQSGYYWLDVGLQPYPANRLRRASQGE